MANTDSKSYWQNEAGRFAALYGAGKRLSPKRFVGSFLDARTKLMTRLAEIGANDTALDLGCGSGVHVKLFSPRCKSIVGLDYSAQMIAAAEAQCQDLPTRNWSFKVGDAHEIPFADASFDWILSMGLLDYVSSPPRVLEESCRVLRPGGRIVFTYPRSPSPFFILRTPLGNRIRDKLFDLPPITNTITRPQLGACLRSLKLELEFARSIWTAMWIVRARKLPASD